MKRKVANILGSVALSVLIILAGSFYFFKSAKKISNPVSLNITKDSGSENKNLKSFFDNKNDYELAFSHAYTSEKRKVMAGITSHHFLAKDLIAQFYSGIVGDYVENVIVVGPDHYRALATNKVNAVTTELTWETPYGKLKPNKDLIEEILKNNNDIEINNNIFKSEHSIYTEVPFVKKVFPQAKIIPIVVKNTYNYEKFINIGEKLKKISGDNTLLIASSDFTHEAIASDAEKSDKQSITNLQNLSVNNLDKITCDCRACLSVMLGFLGKDSQNNFYLIESKNSSDFGSPELKVTSYVSGYFLPN